MVAGMVERLMYILIDTDHMQLKAKHPNFERLCEYGILVCSESAEVLPLEGWAIERFSAVDIQRLYINVTGNTEGAMYPTKTICKILQFYFNKMEETQLAQTISQQAQYAIDNGLEGSCEYSPSGGVPITAPAEKPVFKVQIDVEAEKHISQGGAVTLTQPTQQAFSAAQRVTPTAAPQSRSAGTAARTSGTRDLIYETADEMWVAAGKPTDKPEVLKLRKLIMIELEKVGVKKNTSSNTLGKWHMERAPY